MHAGPPNIRISALKTLAGVEVEMLPSFSPSLSLSASPSPSRPADPGRCRASDTSSSRLVGADTLETVVVFVDGHVGSLCDALLALAGERHAEVAYCSFRIACCWSWDLSPMREEARYGSAQTEGCKQSRDVVAEVMEFSVRSSFSFRAQDGRDRPENLPRLIHGE